MKVALGGRRRRREVVVRVRMGTGKCAETVRREGRIGCGGLERVALREVLLNGGLSGEGAVEVRTTNPWNHRRLRATREGRTTTTHRSGQDLEAEG